MLRIGPAPLDKVLAELEALEDDPTLARERWPWLEVRVELEAPIPDLRAQVDAALEDKALRLLRLERRLPRVAEQADTARVDLESLGPRKLFERTWQARWGEPPGETVMADLDSCCRTSWTATTRSTAHEDPRPAPRQPGLAARPPRARLQRRAAARCRPVRHHRPHGAGKSTLLDALCLALYGSTPRLRQAPVRDASLPTWRARRSHRRSAHPCCDVAPPAATPRSTSWAATAAATAPAGRCAAPARRSAAACRPPSSRCATSTPTGC
nr:exonuclease SbcCD subunit D C-terminal domain-containing protein [Halomonas socia]